MPTITSYFGFLLAASNSYNPSSIYYWSEQDTTYSK